MNKENTSILKITPKKIYNKNPDQKICRLCGDEPSRCSKIFSKPGKNKNLHTKILQATGINILETDGLSDILCQTCERFVESASKFRYKCLQTQHKLSSVCSIKRIISPINRQPLQNIQNTVYKSSSKRSLFADPNNVSCPSSSTIIIDVNPFTPLKTNSSVSFVNEKFVSVQHFPTSTPRLIAPKIDVSHPDKTTGNFHSNESRLSDELISSKLSNNLSIEEAKILKTSIYSGQPSLIAETICKIPSLKISVKNMVKNEIKNEIKNDIEDTCKRLCSNSNGSMLGKTSYTDMSMFNTDKIWNELCTNFPYLVDILKTICKANDDPEKHDVIKIKLSFIYSILLNMRWSKLSLAQRVNTVLMIESGSSKKVRKT